MAYRHWRRIEPNPEDQVAAVENLRLWKKAYIAMQEEDCAKLETVLSELEAEEDRENLRLFLEWIIADPKLEKFVMESAQKNVVSEVLFITGLMQNEPILRDARADLKELMYWLDHPNDDLALALSFYEVLKNRQQDDKTSGPSREARALMAAERSGVDLKLLRAAEKFTESVAERAGFGREARAGWIIQENSPYNHEKPIGRIRDLFNSAFGDNRVHYLGGEGIDEEQPFYNHVTGDFFAIHPGAMAGRQNIAWMRAHFSLYAMLKKSEDGKKTAEFIVHVSKMSKHWQNTLVHEVSVVRLTVGPATVKGIQFIIESLKEDYRYGEVIFHMLGFDPEASIMRAVCDKSLVPSLVGALATSMKKIAQSSEQSSRRMYLKEFGVTAIVSPGLQVLAVDFSRSAAIEFWPIMRGERMSDHDFKTLSECIQRMVPNKEVRFATMKKGRGFVAEFPDSEECARVLDQAKMWPWPVELKRGLEQWKPGGRWSPIHKQTQGGVECSVCLCECTEWINLSLCGHSYCLAECAPNTIRFAPKFPIECCHESCAGTLLFEDVDAILESLGARGAALLEPVLMKSTRIFLGAGKLISDNGFKECQACGRVLKSSAEKIKNSPPQATALQEVLCLRCAAARCAACGYESHEEKTCQEAHAVRLYGDEGLMTWRRGDTQTRSFCPNDNCFALIEKAGGCDHMECKNCGAHFCWVCKYKGTSLRDIHAHLENHHGGNGLPEDFIPEDVGDGMLDADLLAFFLPNWF